MEAAVALSLCEGPLFCLPSFAADCRSLDCRTVMISPLSLSLRSSFPPYFDCLDREPHAFRDQTRCRHVCVRARGPAIALDICEGGTFPRFKLREYF